MQDWTGTQLIARLVAAAKLSETAFRERGLDVHYDRRQLVSAAVSAACAPASATPITNVSTSTKAIALSFDDGPSPFTPQVLDVLRHYRAHATFFVLGENLTDRSRVLGRMLVSGNEIANGTWTGAHASTIGANALESELRRTDAEIESAVPFRPCLTRPPYRENVTRLATLAGGLNLTTALWSVDPRDFTLRSPASDREARAVAGAARLDRDPPRRRRQRPLGDGAGAADHPEDARQARLSGHVHLAAPDVHAAATAAPAGGVLR